MTAKLRLFMSAAFLVASLSIQTAGAQGPAPARDPFDKTVRVADHMEPAIPHPEGHRYFEWGLSRVVADMTSATIRTIAL